MHCVSLNNFSRNEIEKLIKSALEIKNGRHFFSEKVVGKILGALFLEPSTRTQFSFQTAMLRLGGQYVGCDSLKSLSISKGENFKDTIKTLSLFVDALVIRHPLEGASKAASLFSNCPVINAGDGKNEHPTQAITDLTTMFEFYGRIDGLTIGFCGDLKFSRTVNSLIRVLATHYDVRFVFISSEEFKISDCLKKFINNCGRKFEECGSIESVIEKLDVLYVTRIQTERLDDVVGNKLNVQFQPLKLTKKSLISAKQNLVILHPLPRVNEIDAEIDIDPRAKYFNQVENGMYARMAIIPYVLSKQEESGFKGRDLNLKCCNSKCITNFEKYLPKKFVEDNEGFCCEFCGCVVTKSVHFV